MACSPTAIAHRAVALAPVGPGPEADVLAGAAERPVFFDASGRRARVVRWLGRLLVTLMAGWLLAVGVGALTPLSLPGAPGLLAASGPGARSAALSRSSHLTPAPPTRASLRAELSERS